MSCKCDTNRAGHFTLDAHASRPVACIIVGYTSETWGKYSGGNKTCVGHVHSKDTKTNKRNKIHTIISLNHGRGMPENERVYNKLWFHHNISICLFFIPTPISRPIARRHHFPALEIPLSGIQTSKYWNKNSVVYRLWPELCLKMYLYFATI